MSAFSAQNGPIIRRIYSGVGLLLGGKAAAGVISLGYMIIAARALGPVDYGILILVHSFVTTICGIAEFPVGQAIVRYGAHGLNSREPGRVAKLLRFAALVEGAGGIVAITTIALFAPIAGPRLGWSAEAQAVAIPYSLAALGSLRSAPAGFLQLMRRFDLLGAHNAVQPTVRLFGAVIAAYFEIGLMGFLVAWLIAAVAEWAVLWALGIYIARKTLGPGLHHGGVDKVRAENPAIWRFMVGSNADVTFGELAGRMVPLLIGYWLGPTSAGLYAVAQRATVIIAQPAQILGSSAYTELARLVSVGASAATLRHTLIRVILIAVAAATPVMIAVGLFSKQLVLILAGPAFLAAQPVMIWLVAARVIFLIGPPCSAALLALGKPGLSVTANLASSLGMLPLLPLLINFMGLIGSGVQAIIQAVVSSAILVVFVWRASQHMPDN